MRRQLRACLRITGVPRIAGVPEKRETSMKIMVSACLVGENCKYNGGNNRNEKLLALLAGHEVIAVCPEQMGGLPTPRVPSEVKDGVVTARDGRIVDAEFRAGAAKCLEIARRERPDLIVLQSRSPSCGVRQRYDGSFTGTLVDGPGVTAQLLMENGFRPVDVEGLKDLEDLKTSEDMKAWGFENLRGLESPRI